MEKAFRSVGSVKWACAKSIDLKSTKSVEFQSSSIRAAGAEGLAIFFRFGALAADRRSLNGVDESKAAGFGRDDVGLCCSDKQTTRSWMRGWVWGWLSAFRLRDAFVLAVWLLAGEPLGDGRAEVPGFTGVKMSLIEGFEGCLNGASLEPSGEVRPVVKWPAIISDICERAALAGYVLEWSRGRRVELAFQGTK